jgi:hypothetical protein
MARSPHHYVTTAFQAVFLLAVPALTRSADIKLNKRVSLRRPFELLTLSQSCGLARHSRTPARPCVPRDQGSPLREGTAAPLNRVGRKAINDAATQLDPLDRDSGMLDNLARSSFEFCFCG